MPRKLRALKAGTVATLTLIGCLSCTAPPETTAPPVPRANAVPFVQQRDEALGSARATLRLLIPVGNCVLGIADGPGRVSNWVGEQGCTSLVPSPGSMLAVTDAVSMDDGSIIGVGESLLRRDPDGSVHQLAALPPPGPRDYPPTAFALARSGQRLIVVNVKAVYNDQGKGFWRFFPTAWVSTDGGVTVHEIPLPLPPVDNPLNNPDFAVLNLSRPAMRIAADGKTVLAMDGVGYAMGPAPRMWRSVDGGRTWSVLPLPVHPTLSHYDVVALLKAGGRWLLVLQDPRPPSLPRIVLSSPDGAEWTVEKGLDLGSGWVVAATQDREHNLVLIGYDDLRNADGTLSGNSGLKTPPIQCGAVWTGSIGALVRQNLGCASLHKKPTAVATLADGRVFIADDWGNLWIRR